MRLRRPRKLRFDDPCRAPDDWRNEKCQRQEGPHHQHDESCVQRLRVMGYKRGFVKRDVASGGFGSPLQSHDPVAHWIEIGPECPVREGTLGDAYETTPHLLPSLLDRSGSLSHAAVKPLLKGLPLGASSFDFRLRIDCRSLSS